MMKAMVYGMSCRRIIIFLALFYQPKKKTSLSAYGDNDTNAICRNINNYLADIDEQATEMMFRLVEQMADKEGVTEQLKVENPMLWVGRMNEIQARAREIVYADIIYK